MSLRRLAAVLSLLPLLCLASADIFAQSSTQPCGFQGDADTYGLGIRMGIYLQWITTSLADNFVPDEAITMRGVNNCFQLSTFIALIYVTLTRPVTNNNPLYAVEAWILLLFCFGGVCSSRSKGNAVDRDEKFITATDPDELGRRSASFSNYGATTIGGLIQLSLGASFTFYGIWFVYIGMDTMAHSSCGNFAFFFAPVDLFHWFRTLLKVVFTPVGIFTGLIVISTIAYFFTKTQTDGLAKSLGTIFGFAEDVPASVRVGERVVTELKNISFGLELVWFIIATELVIRWNHISNVGTLHATGQLIPFVVAVSGLVRVLWKMIVKYSRGDYRIGKNFSLKLPFISFSSRGTGR